MGRKIYIHTLGCPKNQADSDALARILRERGFCMAGPDAEDSAEASDAVIVNTCGFIEDAKRESIGEILRLASEKSGGAKMLVIGCLAKRYRNELKKELPEIDGLFGVGEEDGIARYLEENLRGPRVPRAKNKPSGVSRGPQYAYLKIAEGCGRRCTYCVIPSIRGPHISRRPEEILREAERKISEGARELVLVSQDLLDYGKDTGGCGVPELLRELSSISGEFWIRLLYLNPFSIDDSIIEAVASGEKVCKYMDIPFQHSEEKILRLMGRPGGRKEFLALISRLRSEVPDIAIRSTLMVGFPGETETDFEGLLKFVKEARLNHLGVFAYSREEETPSAKMKGRVPKKTMRKRLGEIMEAQSGISYAHNLAAVGRRYRALFDAPGIARIYSQAPEIDGVVLTGVNDYADGFRDIIVKEAQAYDLVGELA